MPSLSYGDDSVVPYDTSGILSVKDPSQDPTNGFGISVDSYYKKLYNMYPIINTCVFRIFEYALGLTYELYHKWVDFKSSNKDYDKLLDSILRGYGMSGDSDDKNSFNYFISLFLAYSRRSDPNLIFNPQDYIDKVMELKNELISDNDAAFIDNDISISVACTHNEFPMLKDKLRTFYSYYNSALAFVVCPFLKSVENTISESLVEVKQEVYIDINRLICFLATNFDPGALPEYLSQCEQNKEEYIKNGLDIFKEFPEKFTRKIILELFDNHENIQSDWSYFLKSIDNGYNKVLNKDEMRNICSKLRHFGISMPENITSVIFKNDPGGRNNPTRKSLLQYNHFLDALQSAFYGLTDESPIEYIGLALLCKAFSKSFTSSVLYATHTSSFKEGKMERGIWFNEYCRDFYRSYSKQDLREEASKISDYNIRDFMNNIISEEVNSCLEKIYSGKMSNGEYAYFMYCKVIRSTWINIILQLYSLLIINTNSKIINDTNKSNNINKYGIYKSITKETNDYLFNVLNILRNLYINDMTSYKETLLNNDYLSSLLNQMTMTANNYNFNFDNKIDKNCFGNRDISQFDEKVFSTIDCDNSSSFDENNLKTRFEAITQTFIQNGIIPINVDD